MSVIKAKVLSGVLLGIVVLVSPVWALAERPWIVDGTAAAALVEQGATVLDTRSRTSFEAEHVRGAQRVTWQQFSQARGPQQGELLRDDAVLIARLRRVGVSGARPVVVVGDAAQGWGEEGRIVWMLRTLGHEQATMVDGGHGALRAAKAPLARGVAGQAPLGDLVIRRVGRYEVSAEALLRSVKAGEGKVVDTRERREFEGATPYGESRGGHVPGAAHLHFSALFAPDGTLLPPDQIEARLKALGITSMDEPITLYCTGGIRSAWVVVVLQHLGYRNARNYAGSMWQWSARDATSYPLSTSSPREPRE